MLAGNIIDEHAGNAHAPVLGELPASGFLAREPVALGNLGVIAHPAIDHRLFGDGFGINVH
nr:hypothetical protein [Thalassobaculum litoreum]